MISNPALKPIKMPSKVAPLPLWKPKCPRAEEIYLVDREPQPSRDVMFKFPKAWLKLFAPKQKPPREVQADEERPLLPAEEPYPNR